MTGSPRSFGGQRASEEPKEDSQRGRPAPGTEMVEKGEHKSPGAHMVLCTAVYRGSVLLGT